MSFAPRPVLEGVGIGQPLNFSGWFQGQQLAAMRQNRADRLALSQEGRRNQVAQDSANYLGKALHMHDGTVYDDAITQGYGNILAFASSEAKKGKDFASILNSISPMVSQLNSYSTKAKQIDDSNKATLAKVPKDQGYDADNLLQLAKDKAFYDTDPKTGEKILKSPDKIDPARNYILDTIKERPEDVTDMSGWDKYFKDLPKHQTDKNITTITGPGKSTTQRVRTISNPFEDFDKDDDGNIKRDETGAPTGLVPKFDTVKDKDGKPLKDEYGNSMRALDNEAFDQITHDRPGLSDALRGETKRHFAAIKKDGDEDVSENDPRFRLYARHLAYQKASQLQNSTYQFLDQQKETGQAVKDDQMSDPAWQKRQIDYEAKKAATVEQSKIDVQNRDAKLHPDMYNSGKKKKADDDTEETIEPIAHMFTDPHNYLKDAPVLQKDGRSVVDILPFMNKGVLKADAKNPYSEAYYNPATHSLELYKKGANDPQVVTAANAGQFMSQIAEANGTNRGDVKPLLNKYGFGQGKFNLSPEDQKKAQDALASQKDAAISKRVDTFAAKNDLSSIKGTQTPDGAIVGGDIRSITSALGLRDKFAIDVRGADGKTVTKTFKTADELKDYIKGGATAPAVTPATGKPAASKKGILD